MNPGNGIETINILQLQKNLGPNFLLMNPGNGIETTKIRILRNLQKGISY